MGAEIRIAVVGMACRYPDTKSPAELWRNTLAQRRAFRALPAERLSSGYRGDPDDPDRTYVRRAGLLNGWRFDRARFGIPAGLYRAADLTHWLALETASAALADAGHVDGDGLDRDATGVVIGNSLAGEFGRAAQLRTRWPYVRDAAETALRENGTDESMVLDVLSRMEELVKDPFPVPGDESLAGGLSNTIAGRICNQFDFHGTGFTVDGACSSSLLAVMAACRALAAGELNFALAGGVDLSLDPFELVGFARLGALATDRMRVYDSSPTGFLPGEGCGIVALARAEDAEAQGLHTYGHIVGWGTSSDGSGGLTRPEPTGQALALTRAYRMAQLPPESVALVEGHGTGTAVGDEVELEALATVRGERAQPAALGSIKANIGHTKAAAGAASLVKAVLAVHHGVLPPTTGCESPHDLLRRTPALRVLGEAEPWDEDMRRAAVSSMGFGGINTHVVLESVRSRSSSPRSSLDPVWTRRTPRQVIVVLAADDAATLGDRLEEFAMRAGAYSDAELHDLAATLWYEREGTSPAYRAALVGEHADALVSAAHQARAALSKADPVVVDTAAGYVVGHGRVRVGLLFPGQAAPVRDVLPDWATDLAVPASPEGLRADVTDTSIAQPAIVWQSLVGMSWLERIRCHVVAAAGHSLGELSALAWSGALTADDAVRLAAARGRIMTCHGTPGTTMASLSAGSGEAERFIRSSRVVIAARNGPANTVVSGPADEVAAVVQNAANAGVAAVELPVSHGFHSPAMEGAAEPFRDHLRSVPLNEPRTPVLSTITGIDLTDDDLVELLVRQLTRPVLFEDVLDRMNERCDLLVEVGAGTTLSALATATGAVVVSLDCGGPDRHHALATAALAVAGAADLEAWYAGRPYRRVDLGYRPELLANPCDASAGHAGIAPGRDPRPADAAPAVPSPGGPPAATASL
ncbi:type I polyketide synthase, partial [Prauserella halophila]